MVAGVFIDTIKYFCPRQDYAYRFCFVWSLFFTIMGAILLVIIYRKWYKLGGDAHFQPPAPWIPDGYETIPVVPTVGVQTKWLNLALRLFDGIMQISVLGILVLLCWMYRSKTPLALQWYLGLFLPLSLLAWLAWRLLASSIRKDMARSHTGKILSHGLPHHGMLLVFGLQFLLASGLWLAQVLVTINMKMEMEAIVFGAGNIITNFLLIGGVWLFSRLEQGYLVTLDRPLVGPSEVSDEQSQIVGAGSSLLARAEINISEHDEEKRNMAV